MTCNYRVKETPKYRPYKDAQEFLQAQKEHGMYLMCNQTYSFPFQIYANSVVLCNLLSDEVEDTTFCELYENFTWQDGTHCGIKK